MRRVAVIDTGTNSTRLLVAESATDGMREVMRATNITRLGEGVDSARKLGAAARKRVEECVAGYAASIGELGAEKAMIIATSSVRDAEDGESFIAGLASRFRFEHRILSGQEEASLAFSGAMTGMTEDLRGMLFDVGGGSTEIVAGLGGAVEMAVSMDIGCVRLKERALKNDPPAPSELQSARLLVRGMLDRSVDRQSIRKPYEARAVAGTVTSLAALDLGLESYERDLVHGHVMARKRVDGLLDWLSGMSVEERQRLPVLEAGRSDVIVAGAVIVTEIMGFLDLETFTVSERDILDGAALAMYAGQL